MVIAANLDHPGWSLNRLEPADATASSLGRRAWHIHIYICVYIYKTPFLLERTNDKLELFRLGVWRTLPEWNVSLPLQGGQPTVLVTNDTTWAFKQKLEFGESCTCFFELDSFLVLKDQQNKCQPLEHLRISLSQYFPPDLCLMSQNHEWVKGSFEMWTCANIKKKLFKFSSLFQITVSKMDFLHVLPLKEINTTDWIQKQIGKSSQTLKRFAKL